MCCKILNMVRKALLFRGGKKSVVVDLECGHEIELTVDVKTGSLRVRTEFVCPECSKGHAAAA